MFSNSRNPCKLSPKRTIFLYMHFLKNKTVIFLCLLITNNIITPQTNSNIPKTKKKPHLVFRIFVSPTNHHTTTHKTHKSHKSRKSPQRQLKKLFLGHCRISAEQPEHVPQTNLHVLCSFVCLYLTYISQRRLYLLGWTECIRVKVCAATGHQPSPCNRSVLGSTFYILHEARVAPNIYEYIYILCYVKYMEIHEILQDYN